MKRFLFGLIALYPLAGYFSSIFLGRNPEFLLFLVSIIIFVKILIQNQIRIDIFSGLYLVYLIIDILIKYVILDFPLIPGIGYVYYTFSLLVSLLIIIIINSTNITDKNIIEINNLLKYIIIIACVVSIYQFVFDPYFLIPENDFLLDTNELEDTNNIRVSSIFRLEGDGKGVMFSVPIFGLLILSNKRTIKQNELLFIIFPIFIITFLSGSRAGLINFIIMLIFSMKENKKLLGYISYIVYFLFMIYFVVNILDFKIDSWVENRLQADTKSRTDIFEYTYDMVSKNPVFGDGRSGLKGFDDEFASKYTFGNKVHNGFLRTLINYGIIGLLIFGIIVFVFLSRAYYLVRHHNDRTILGVFLIFFITNFTVDITTFMWPGLLLSLVYYKYISNRKIKVS